MNVLHRTLSLNVAYPAGRVENDDAMPAQQAITYGAAQFAATTVVTFHTSNAIEATQSPRFGTVSFVVIFLSLSCTKHTGRYEAHSMELEDHHGSRDELWQNIETLLSSQCDTHDEIDNVLRSYLVEVEAHDVDADEDSITHCAYLLYTSLLFADHAAYVRRQLVHVLLQVSRPIAQICLCGGARG